MHFAVLASADSWYLRDLTRAAGDRYTIVPVAFDELAVSVSRGSVRITAGDVDLMAMDAVLVRTMPPGTLEQVVFRMDALARLHASGIKVVNAPKAVEAAVDKFLTTALLEQAGFLVPHTITCQTADAAVAAFHSLGGDVVLKPVFGAEGRGITRLNDENLALRAFKMLEQLGAVLYLQPFIEHEGYDLRLLVIGERVLGMKRSNPLDWRTNVSRGATAEAIAVDDRYVEMALRAARAVGADVAGVDLLPGRDGSLYAIEVNAVPGWKALATAHGLDIASMVLDYVAARCKSS
jgi:RimK family alpha-L-glutamate ligase